MSIGLQWKLSFDHSVIKGLFAQEESLTINPSLTATVPVPSFFAGVCLYVCVW